MTKDKRKTRSMEELDNATSDVVKHKTKKESKKIVRSMFSISEDMDENIDNWTRLVKKSARSHPVRAALYLFEQLPESEKIKLIQKSKDGSI